MGTSKLPEEGERVATDKLAKMHRKRFLFDVGETVETFNHGHVTIKDRYGTYCIPRPLCTDIPVLRPTYDLKFESEDRTEASIDQDSLFGYHILIDDPRAPEETFEGRLADRVQTITPKLRVGDTVMFDGAESPTNGSTTATVTAFSVWKRLICCRLEYDDGSVYWDPYNTIMKRSR